MTTLTFDTYDFIKTLKDSGIKEEQAKAIVDRFENIDLKYIIVSKHDISDLRLSLRVWLDHFYKK